jgi:hypothetical protein
VALLSAQEARDPQLTVAGYGDTSAARHPKGLEVGWPPTRLRDGLAYLSVRGGASNCLGDSGGPVFEGQQVGHADERHVLVAVISSRTVGSTSGPCSGSLGHAVRLDRQDMTTWVCASTRDAIDGCRSRRSDALGGRTAQARARAPQPAPAGRR